MTGTPYYSEGWVIRRAWFDTLHGEALALVEGSGPLVGHEMFNEQPISAIRQLPDEGTE